MEENQLDFNQPLLSVRRFSSTASSSEAEVKKKADHSLPTIPPLPVYKSELKSGPIRNPGTVPFRWEQSPGRPKDEGKSQTRSIERPPIAPNLPPGRISNIKQQSFDKVSEDRRNTRLTQSATSSLEKNTAKCERSTKGMDDAGSSSSEDVSEAYTDAVDTLSRTESFFFNCSVTGVSGLDDAELKPSTFSADDWTRDFMMDRFLPAAKAIASEAPQHTNRRQPVTQVKPRNIQRIVNMDKQPTPKQCIPRYSQFHGQDKTVEESDDEVYYSGPRKSATTVCGLLPRFCLLNPVPGIRLQGAIELPNRALAGGSKASAYCEIPQKAKNFKVNESDPARKGSKNFQELLDEESIDCKPGLGSPVEKTLYIDSIHKVKSPKSNSTSSNAKRLSDIPGVDFDSILKSREIKVSHPTDSSLLDIKISTGMVEKAILKAKNQEFVDSTFLSSPEKSPHGLQTDAKKSSKKVQDHDEKSNKLASSKFDGNKKIDLEMTLRKKLSDQEKLHGHVPKYVSSSNSRIADDIEADDIKADDQEKSHGHILKYVSSSNSRIADDIQADESQLQMGLSGQEECLVNHQLPLSLPPPKSPSDSWLKRTLPTVSMKNSSPWSFIGTTNHGRILASKPAPVDPKWETIVRTSNVQHGHLRFSEERLSPIPEA